MIIGTPPSGPEPVVLADDLFPLGAGLEQLEQDAVGSLRHKVVRTAPATDGFAQVESLGGHPVVPVLAADHLESQVVHRVSPAVTRRRSEEHTSELQSPLNLVC